MNSDFKDKVDLRAQVYAGITYRQVRDAFNRLGRSIHQDALGLILWRDEIGAAHRRDTGYPSPPTLDRLYQFDRALDEGRPWTAKLPETSIAIRRSRKRSAVLCRILAKEGFIKRPAHNFDIGKWWEPTERASTLKAQKLLRRISRNKGLSYLPRVIEAAERFNRDSGPNYYITEVYLFGSLVVGLPDVGDVDLIVVTKKKYPDDDYEQWTERETQRLRKIRPSSLALPSYLRSTEAEGASLIGKISPYISAVSRESMLSQLQEEGEPSEIFYAFNPPAAAPQETEDWVIKERRAQEFLRTLGLSPTHEA
jgi:hypothetical protein